MSDLSVDKLELADLQERLSKVERESANLGKELIPFYVSRKQLREAIAATHKTITSEDEDGNERLLIVGFGADGKGKRAPLFRAWTALFHNSAPQRELQRRCRAQQREFGRQIKKLTDWIAKQERKAAAFKYDPLTGEIL
jgi:hypothetical protein